MLNELNKLLDTFNELGYTATSTTTSTVRYTINKIPSKLLSVL